MFAPTVPAPGTGKSIGTILTQAFALYQRNFATLLLACAVLMAPAALLRASAVTLILTPTVATEWSTSRVHELSRKTADEFRQQLREAEQDPEKFQANQAEHQKEMQDLANAWTTTGKPAVGGVGASLLGLLAVIVGLALVYGLAVPLTTGALTILVADRATGGTAGVRQAYGLLFGRLDKLTSAVILAFIFVLLGFFLFVIPGLVLGFLFAFVTPVVLLENVGGMEALKRSVNLVKTSAVQVFLVFLVFAGIRIFTQVVAYLFVPGRALLGSLVEDALMILFMPVPIIGTVLLYLDIRRQAGTLDDRTLRAGIDGLRRA
jgi:hypothetical protein